MCDLDLARRAVACRGWRWLRGSVTTEGLRVISVDDRGKPSAFIDYNWNLTTWCNGNVERELRGELPNFNDPTTRGCLLQLVREAWGKQVYAMPIYFAERITCWLAVVPDPATDEWDWTGFDGPDEVSALIAALEAAPERKQ